MADIGPVRNIAPRGRLARTQDRETIEKNNLKQRTTNFVRYRPDEIDQPFKVPEFSVGFMADADRFHTDVAGDFKKLKEQRIVHNQQVDEYKRTQHIQRESNRWAAMEQKEQKEDAYWEALRADSNNPKVRRNLPSVPYDLVTMQYNDNQDGQRLKYQDDLVKHRAVLRAESLRSRMNGAFNPLTGDALQPLRVPAPPTKNFVDPKSSSSSSSSNFGPLGM